MKIRSMLLVCLMTIIMSACGSVEDWEDAVLEIDCSQKPAKLVGVTGTIKYEISLKGPQSKSIVVNDGDTAEVTLAVGDYTIYVTAFVNSLKKFEGAINFNVKSGVNNTSIVGIGFFDIYYLGDTGPGNGKIFYKDEVGFIVYTSATDTVGTTCHYLEAAPDNWKGGGSDPQLQWSTTILDITGTSQNIGTGRKNTALILAAHGASGAPAANACATYINNGKDDWFLPSINELTRLYLNKSDVGVFTSGSYWSSSEAGTAGAWFRGFGSGGHASTNKGDAISVRPIRAF